MGLIRLIFAAVLFVSSLGLIAVAITVGAVFVLPVMVVFFLVFFFKEADKESEKDEFK